MAARFDPRLFDSCTRCCGRRAGEREWPTLLFSHRDLLALHARAPHHCWPARSCD